jgi:SAM-dependent methyltransferase
MHRPIVSDLIESPAVLEIRPFNTAHLPTGSCRTWSGFAGCAKLARVMPSTLIPQSTQTALPDPYVALVRTYDAETGDMRDDLAAYVTLARRYGDPLLDVGCGTGRVAFELAQAGHQVVGIDTSTPMLERARRKHSGPASIRWQEADVTALALDEQFGLAVFAYNGFMHLLEQPRQVAALERIAAHLKPGGALALDLPNPVEMFQVEDTPGLVLERIFNDPDTGEQVMQQSLASLDRAAQLLSVTWVYDRIGADEVVHRHVVPVVLRYTMAAELRLLLAQAGFAAVQIYGDYDFGPYDEDSPRLFTLAEKSGSAS